MDYLLTNSIESGEHYPVPIACQRALADRTFEVFDDCPTAERICLSEVSLPVHPYLTDEEVDRVIRICNEWSEGTPSRSAS